MENEKLYVNGMEFITSEQPTLNEDILRRKLNNITKQNNRNKKLNATFRKIILGLLIALAAVIIKDCITMHSCKELQAKNDAMRIEYNEILVDYTQLKTDLDRFNEMLDNYDRSPIIQYSYNYIIEKYSTFPGGYSYNEEIPLEDDLQRYAYTKCIEYDIDYAVLLGLMRHESGFTPSAVSKSNDYGLCQINKTNHNWMKDVLGSDWDPMDPYDSIDAATYMLNNIKENYSYANTYHTLLMCYNMGPSGAKKCIDNGNYSSSYSRSVMGYAEEYGYVED